MGGRRNLELGEPRRVDGLWEVVTCDRDRDGADCGIDTGYIYIWLL